MVMCIIMMVFQTPTNLVAARSIVLALLANAMDIWTVLEQPAHQSGSAMERLDIFQHYLSVVDVYRTRLAQAGP